MLALQVKTKDAVAKTGCKNLNFDDDEIRSYIDVILLNGFALIETNPRSARKFDDAQNLRRYKSLIRERVEESQFGEAFFNIPELALQRASIEKSKTLHELRQNVKAMIPVLKLYRDYQVLRSENDKLMDYACNWVSADEHDLVLIELEKEQRLSSERKRVIDLLMDEVYVPSCDMSDEEMLSAINRYKSLHKCNDEEAGKFYNISRSKITRLRRKYMPMPSV